MVLDDGAGGPETDNLIQKEWKIDVIDITNIFMGSNEKL